MLLKRIHSLERKISEIEREIGKLQKECPEKTSCYLRYGSYTVDYAPGDSHNPNVKDWQLVLADFYAEQATQLLRKREVLLAQKYRLTSRYLRLTAEPFAPLLCVPRFRKPNFRPRRDGEELPNIKQASSSFSST